VTSEDRATNRRKRSSGWIATLLGAALLVLLGFGVGVMVGASIEDPDLIASVVAGQAQEVGLPPEDTIADRLGDTAEQAPRPFGAHRSEPVPPPVAAAPPPRAVARGGFSIQVGAFREESPAQGLVRQLESGGFKAYIATSDQGTGQRWRVRVGPVASRGEADELARRLKHDQGLPTWVVADE